MTALEETTKEIPLYFLVLLPKEHRYVVVGALNIDDLGVLMKMVRDSEQSVDFTDETVIQITRAQFLNTIDKNRQNVSYFGNGTRGMAVNWLPAKKEMVHYHG